MPLPYNAKGVSEEDAVCDELDEDVSSLSHDVFKYYYNY